MLTNRIIFDRLMALLRSINPSVPLPVELDADLWESMIDELLCKKAKVLQHRGKIPHKAYYVAIGFVLVFAFDEEGEAHAFRMYGRNTIIGLDCFMQQYRSPFMIWQCRNSVVYSISNTVMEMLYQKYEGLKEFAWKTASQFQTTKEQSRDALLNLPPRQRILRFYEEYKNQLLPPRRSPVLDQDIAALLVMNVKTLRRLRKELMDEGLL